MSKDLFKEALADAKKVTEVAENNAKNAVLNAVLPRIRNLIERELLGEANDDDILLDDELNTADDPTMTPDVVVSPNVDVAVADAISPPDEEGKMTIDLDALGTDSVDGALEPVTPLHLEDEYELSLESIDALNIIKANSIKNEIDFSKRLNKLIENVRKLKAASRIIKESSGYHDKITQMISDVENMYEYIQESVSVPNKQTINSKLEKIFQDLRKLQETAVTKHRMHRRLNEEDEQMDLDVDAGDDTASDGELTLKLTGLPDDVDLDGVGVDLVVDDDGDSDEDDLDVDLDTDDEEDDDDMGDLDLDLDSGDDDDQGTQDTQLESVLKLSDNTIVEIDEKMLSREIARMSRIRESSDMDANGHGVSANVLDDFGGAHDEGEPLDVDVHADSTAKPLGEMDEMDDDMIADDHEMPMESIRRKIAFERRLQGRAKQQALALKKEAVRSRGRKKAMVVENYNKTVKRYNESLKRSNKLSKQLSESASSNRRVSNRLSRSSGNDQQLRTKLAESNLNNVKLAYANKVLQNEALTRLQKAQVIKRLDECKTTRETKLVYESVAPVASRRRRQPLSEGARTGSGSRLTRPGSATQTLNEGAFETDRWARLAGITTK